MRLHIYSRFDAIGIVQAMVLLPATSQPTMHLSSLTADGEPITYDLDSSHDLTAEQTDALIAVLQ